MEKIAALVSKNNELSILPPALVGREGVWPARRFLEFFTVHIRNAKTRAEYSQAAGLFLNRYEAREIPELRCIQPMHVAEPGITDYLTIGGKLEVAQRMVAHSNAKTTGLYDRRSDDVSLREVEKIGI